MVTISVIMPVYNGEKYIKEAIDSILNQSYEDFELIIINDGSNDATEEIILSYSDNRIIYLKNDINLKLIKTLNKGVKLAKGKYIARMDADDIAFPNRFETQLKYFMQYPNIGIVNGRSFYLYTSGRIKKPISFFWKPEASPYLQPFTNTVSHPSVMVLAELLKNNLYLANDEALHIEDWELWLRLYSKGIQCITTNEPLLYYRITDTSINSLYKNEQINNMTYISEKYLENELGFKINNKTLRYIIGDKRISMSLKDILQCFNSYLSHIKNRFIVNDAILFDLELWIYDFCLRDLKYKFKMRKKVFMKDCLFFVLHFNHKNIIKILFNKMNLAN